MDEGDNPDKKRAQAATATEAAQAAVQETFTPNGVVFEGNAANGHGPATAPRVEEVPAT